MSRYKGAFNKYLELLGAMFEDVAFNDNNSDTKVEQKRRNVCVIVYDTLVNEPTADWCIHKEFKQSIEESKQREDFRPEKASEAFCHIERYIILILLMPWKQEYRRIKKYCGFYQNAIENTLSKAEPILKLAGFNEITHGVLVLTKVHPPDELKYIAFECFVASTELKIIADSWEKAKLSRHSKLKVMYGDGHIPEADPGKYNEIMPGNVSDGIKTNFGSSSGLKPSIDRSSTEHYRTKLKEHQRQAQKLAGPDSVNTDFPFVDDESKQSMDFEEGTLEDHVKASLQVVENNESTPTAFVEPVPRSISASQEWSFVHEGLKQKFGNQYFEGQRKDILNNEGDKKDDNVIKQKPYLHPVKFGDNPWSERLTKDNRLLPEGQVQNTSGYDSAYQSGLQAQFPPSIQTSIQPEKPFLTRSASAAYGRRKYDTDVVIKKSNLNTQGALLSHTVPIARRPSAPVQKVEDNSLTKHFSKMQIHQGNEQGIDTLRNDQNNLSKDTGVGRVPVTRHPTVASMVSGGRSSGLGESFNSRGYVGKSVDGRGSITSRNEQDGLATTAPSQIPNNWHCTNCTYLNDCSSNICKMCSKTRDGQLDTDSPSVGSTSKVCDKCTLENECNSTQCQACGNALGGSHTVV